MIRCSVCQAADRKYKCPNCEIPYCSIQCYKSHNESNTCKPNKQNGQTETENEDNVEAVENTYQFPTQHTVPLEKLKLLGTNKTLKSLLANPHLRTMLTALTKTKNIQHAMNMVMLEPIFVEFAMECLKTVDNNAQEEEDLENAELKQFVSQIKQLVEKAEEYA